MKTEITSWVSQNLSDIEHFVYVADDPTAPLHPPQNKGRESMIYLTYIIDHYHNLSDVTIFTHAQRWAPHNNNLFDFDLAQMVTALSSEHVADVGYFNLRCHHDEVCPEHIKPFTEERDPAKTEEEQFVRVWPTLHGAEVPVPQTIATACCAQFAASRQAIHAIPLER